MDRPNIILIEYSHRFPHYLPLIQNFDANYLKEEKFSDGSFDKYKVDLAICADEFQPSTFRNILSCKKAGVPVLHIPDGILEWRNMYEHPRSFSENGGMPIHQPHFADKIACIGRNQARMMEAWGSIGKCEVVGCARFDSYIGHVKEKRKSDEPFKILVTTAKKPAFTHEQKNLVDRSLIDLFDWCKGVDYVINGQKIKLFYRFMDNRFSSFCNDSIENCSKGSLNNVLKMVDAVVTTPSTVMLEAMLCNIPVVKLDYTNSPVFTPTIWNITAPEHISSVVSELLDPPAPKMLHQQIILHDCLECNTPAIERLIVLVEEMIRFGVQLKNNKTKLIFPHRIIPISPAVDSYVEPMFDLRELYPGHPVFSRTDTVQLQLENGQLKQELKRLKETLSWRITSPLRKVIEFYLRK